MKVAGAAEARQSVLFVFMSKIAERLYSFFGQENAVN